MKLSRLVAKPIVEVLIANKTIRDAGLHGRTMAPKNRPKTRAVKIGFFRVGLLICGNNLLKSKLKIKNKLTTAKIVKAMGDIIPIALVREACRNFVKINPTINRDRITPKATVKPNKTNDFFDSLLSPVNWLDRYARNAGYNGRTQTAASGANSPAKKDIQKFTRMPGI